MTPAIYILKASASCNRGTFDIIVVGQGSHNFEGRCVLEGAIAFDRQLPVVVVARHVEMECYLEAMQLGAVDYLSPGFSGVEIAVWYKPMRSIVNPAGAASNADAQPRPQGQQGPLNRNTDTPPEGQRCISLLESPTR